MYRDVNHRYVMPDGAVLSIYAAPIPPDRAAEAFRLTADLSRYRFVSPAGTAAAGPPEVDSGTIADYPAGMADGAHGQSDDEALKRAMGRAIARARVAAGFPTQAAFARALDVRFQYMSRVEKGEENLTLETLAKMTTTLRMPMPQFLAAVAEQMIAPTDPPPSRRGRRAA